MIRSIHVSFETCLNTKNDLKRVPQSRITALLWHGQEEHRNDEITICGHMFRQPAKRPAPSSSSWDYRIAVIKNRTQKRKYQKRLCDLTHRWTILMTTPSCFFYFTFHIKQKENINDCKKDKVEYQNKRKSIKSVPASLAFSELAVEHMHDPAEGAA